jgi:probable HAF family extracellular repeat protein
MRQRLVCVVFVGALFIGLGVVAVPASSATAPRYLVEDLGVLPGDDGSVAMGIDEAGDVVGWSYGPAGTRAFLYTDATGMAALPAPAGRPVTTARSVSGSGDVVGTASKGGSDIGHAALWRNGTAQDLGALGTGEFSEARGVNAAGTVVGTSYTNGGGLLGIHAFRFDASGLSDLTPHADTAHAEAVNDVGQIVGWRNGRAFRLSGTTFLDLGVPAGFAQSFGFAVNDTGQVAGHVISPTGNSERVFRYSDGAGMVLIGGTGQYNRAFGINAAGDVVGEGHPVFGPTQAFVFTDGNGMEALNELIDPSTGWFLLGAGDINDAGQIAAWATSTSGARHAVRLTPGTGAPPPSAPVGLTASTSGKRVRLAWTDTSSDETGFRIERAVGDTGFAPLALVGADVTRASDADLERGVTYSYRVQAFNGAGSSAWSNAVVVTRH